MELWAPEEYWLLTDEEREQYRCGPGRGILEKLIPDNWRIGWPLVNVLCITPSCKIHDFCYFWGPDTIEWKREADRVFRNNLIRQVEEAASEYSRIFWWITKARMDKCEVYYQAVKTFGGPAFWSGRNLKKNLEVVVNNTTCEIEEYSNDTGRKAA